MLSSNLASAGNGLAMPGTLQYNGYNGVLFNQPENIALGYGIGGKWDVYTNLFLKGKNTFNTYGLNPIGDFYRGEKRFDSSYLINVMLLEPNSYYYPNYNKTQEGGRNGRTRVYGIWEGRGGIYNLYDPKGDKWGECIPYYLSGSNRYNRFHNGWDYNSKSFGGGADHYPQGRYDTDQETVDIFTTARNKTSRHNPFYEKVILTQSMLGNMSPYFLGKYALEELGLQFHIPYVIDEQGVKQKDINLISNAGHLNGMLNPDDVNFDFTFY